MRQKTITESEIKQLMLTALELVSPESITAGELTKAISKAAGFEVRRSVVKRLADGAVAAGECQVEHRDCIRNNFTVKGAAHYLANRPPVELDDPFDLFD